MKALLLRLLLLGLPKMYNGAEAQAQVEAVLAEEGGEYGVAA